MSECDRPLPEGRPVDGELVEDEELAKVARRTALNRRAAEEEAGAADAVVVANEQLMTPRPPAGRRSPRRWRLSISLKMLLS